MFHRFGCRKSSQKQTKIDPKGDRQQDAHRDGFSMALGSILVDLGTKLDQIGGKLAPASEEMGYQDDVSKSSKLYCCSGPHSYAVVRE